MRRAKGRRPNGAGVSDASATNQSAASHWMAGPRKAYTRPLDCGNLGVLDMHMCTPSPP